MKTLEKEKKDQTDVNPLKNLILLRWHGYEDDGSSGCYNYNYKNS